MRSLATQVKDDTDQDPIPWLPEYPVKPTVQRQTGGCLLHVQTSINVRFRTVVGSTPIADNEP